MQEGGAHTQRGARGGGGGPGCTPPGGSCRSGAASVEPGDGTRHWVRCGQGRRRGALRGSRGMQVQEGCARSACRQLRLSPAPPPLTVCCALQRALGNTAPVYDDQAGIAVRTLAPEPRRNPLQHPDGCTHLRGGSPQTTCCIASADSQHTLRERTRGRRWGGKGGRRGCWQGLVQAGFSAGTWGSTAGRAGAAPSPSPCCCGWAAVGSRDAPHPGVVTTTRCTVTWAELCAATPRPSPPGTPRKGCWRAVAASRTSATSPSIAASWTTAERNQPVRQRLIAVVQDQPSPAEP